jgi:thymidine kinase
MTSLIELADQHLHLKAQCAVCQKPADYSYRKLNNNVLLLIGGKEYYEPRCETCFEQK